MHSISFNMAYINLINLCVLIFHFISVLILLLAWYRAQLVMCSDRCQWQWRWAAVPECIEYTPEWLGPMTLPPMQMIPLQRERESKAEIHSVSNRFINNFRFVSASCSCHLSCSLTIYYVQRDRRTGTVRWAASVIASVTFLGRLDD